MYRPTIFSNSTFFGRCTWKVVIGEAHSLPSENGITAAEPKSRHLALEVPAAQDEILHRGVELPRDGVVLLRDVAHRPRGLRDALRLGHLALQVVAHVARVVSNSLQRDR